MSCISENHHRFPHRLCHLFTPPLPPYFFSSTVSTIPVVFHCHIFLSSPPLHPAHPLVFALNNLASCTDPAKRNRKEKYCLCHVSISSISCFAVHLSGVCNVLFGCLIRGILICYFEEREKRPYTSWFNRPKVEKLKGRGCVQIVLSFGTWISRFLFSWKVGKFWSAQKEKKESAKDLFRSIP